VFVEGVSQFGKNPVCGFVVVCGQDLSTEFADFIFGGHEVEVIGESPTYHAEMSLSVPYSTYCRKISPAYTLCTKKTRISGAIQRMRVSVGEGAGSTSALRYPEEPAGLLALDPQLVCYSWITGIAEVAQIVFVRKRLVEIQYFQTTITDERRREFGQIVEDTIRRIESAQFLPHAGIRFPQNPCSTCPYLGLCLGKQELVDAALVRRPGAENLGWLDELSY